jgi:putative transposase
MPRLKPGSSVLGGLRVRRVLDRMASERGLPEAIVLDNGPEFRGRALAAWSEERRVRLEFIQPGKPAAECLHRKLQRSTARRMSERELVYQSQ